MDASIDGTGTHASGGTHNIPRELAQSFLESTEREGHKRPASPIDTSQLTRKWGIRDPSGLREYCRASGRGENLIEGLIPKHSVGIVVGDSGIGKSPLLYQAAMCVVAGLPFLGHPVAQGRVLYLDFENGLGVVDDLVTGLAKHLGIAEVPSELLLWNYNDASPHWGSGDLYDMVADSRPTWVIVDSLSAFNPEMEEKASFVTRTFQGLRRIIRKLDTTLTTVHHLRKPSNRPQDAPPSLEEGSARQWLLQARGSGALINASDVRIALDKPGTASIVSGLNGKSGEVALVMAGFARVRGEFPKTFLARMVDDDGEPLGYELMRGVALLFNPPQEEAYRRLPQSCRFKEAQRIYGKGGQATTDFLHKCISVGILRHEGRTYAKVEVAE